LAHIAKIYWLTYFPRLRGASWGIPSLSLATHTPGVQLRTPVFGWPGLHNQDGMIERKHEKNHIDAFISKFEAF
jgi:hypothetical protein